MSDYRRRFRLGGTFFFTVVTEGRAPILTSLLSRRLLREALVACRRCHPFTIDAIVLLPDHLHILVTLPEHDSDYPARLALFKAHFTRAWLEAGGAEQPVSASKRELRRRGVWQKRYWEHEIRDWQDLARHHAYILYNPVKHGLVACPHEWPWSSFRLAVRAGIYLPNWLCRCAHRADDDGTDAAVLAAMESLGSSVME